MGVGELAERLGVRYRSVRYALEEGILPTGVEASPGRGEHRDLTQAQAFWLAIVLVLKQNGIRTPLAGKIANYARRAVGGITQNLGWEPGFEPFHGMFETNNQWFVEIGDLKVIRLATTANPSKLGELYELEWNKIGTSNSAPNADPLVILRLDIGRLAGRLAK